MLSSVVGCSSVLFGPVANETKMLAVLVDRDVGRRLRRASSAPCAGGMSILIDTVASGAVTMKMISSTSITSTNGVTLMSAF